MKRFFSISLLIPASLWAQFHFGDLQREVAPFPVSDATGTQLTYPFLGGFNRPRPQFVDFDNDGDPDLFLQENEGAIMYFENSGTDGQPVFLLTEDQFAGINPGAWFRVVDLDSDGDFDILCEWGVARMAWYRNDGSPGNPVFATVFTDLADNNRNPISPERTNLPALTDIDCDGDPDLFLGRSSGSVTHYRHDGFQPDGRPVFQFITDRFEDILIIGITKDNSAKHGANALFFNDMDNDNDPDLIWGDFFSRSLYYLENIGTCQQAEIDTAAIVDGYPVNAPVWTSGFNVPSFCDIDGDNDADLFVTIMGGVYYNGYEKLSNFYFYRNTGNAQSAQFNLETRQFLDGIDFGQYSHPAAADLDDDGDLDFIIGNESNPGGDGGQLYLLTNTGSAFDPALAVSDSNYLNFHSGYRFAPALVDIDNDGDFDLFVGESDGQLDVFRNDGSASSAQFELEEVISPRSMWVPTWHRPLPIWTVTAILICWPGKPAATSIISAMMVIPPIRNLLQPNPAWRELTSAQPAARHYLTTTSTMTWTCSSRRATAIFTASAIPAIPSNHNFRHKRMTRSGLPCMGRYYSVISTETGRRIFSLARLPAVCFFSATTPRV
jgi:hypothetical protein